MLIKSRLKEKIKLYRNLNFGGNRGLNSVLSLRESWVKVAVERVNNPVFSECGLSKVSSSTSASSRPLPYSEKIDISRQGRLKSYAVLLLTPFQPCQDSGR